MARPGDIASRIDHHRRLLKKWERLTLLANSKHKKRTYNSKALKHRRRLQQCLAEQVRSVADESG
jgi:hypothetical protein